MLRSDGLRWRRRRSSSSSGSRTVWSGSRLRNSNGLRSRSRSRRRRSSSGLGRRRSSSGHRDGTLGSRLGRHGRRRRSAHGRQELHRSQPVGSSGWLGGGGGGGGGGRSGRGRGRSRSGLRRRSSSGSGHRDGALGSRLGRHGRLRRSAHGRRELHRSQPVGCSGWLGGGGGGGGRSGRGRIGNSGGAGGCRLAADADRRAHVAGAARRAQGRGACEGRLVVRAVGCPLPARPPAAALRLLRRLRRGVGGVVLLDGRKRRAGRVLRGAEGRHRHRPAVAAADGHRHGTVGDAAAAREGGGPLLETPRGHRAARTAATATSADAADAAAAAAGSAGWRAPDLRVPGEREGGAPERAPREHLRGVLLRLDEEDDDELAEAAPPDRACVRSDAAKVSAWDGLWLEGNGLSVGSEERAHAAKTAIVTELASRARSRAR